MKVTEYRDLLLKALPLGLRVLSVGPPGVGKTFINMEACRQLNFDCISICSALEDPSTIRGYPYKGEGGEARHLLFDGIARAAVATKPTLLLFDDLGMASETTMRSIVRLVQFGEIDNKKLPACVVIGAATNDVGHGAGVYGMIEPLKSRFHTIVEVATDVDSVVAYGLAHGWPTDLLAFLRNSPDSLNDWRPSKSMKIDGACPRGWDYAATWISKGIADPEVIGGCVGKGQAAKYLAFRELISELPDVDAVILDPDAAPLPENPGAKWMISMALANRMSNKNFGQITKYLHRMPGMFRAYCVRDAFKAEAEKRKAGQLKPDYQPISTSRDFTAWSISQEGKEIVGAAL